MPRWALVRTVQHSRNSHRSSYLGELVKKTPGPVARRQRRVSYGGDGGWGFWPNSLASMVTDSLATGSAPAVRRRPSAAGGTRDLPYYQNRSIRRGTIVIHGRSGGLTRAGVQPSLTPRPPAARAVVGPSSQGVCRARVTTPPGLSTATAARGAPCRFGGLARRCRREVSGAAVSYTHLRAHETRHDLVCRLLLEKKK